jgi:hypothetical protein
MSSYTTPRKEASHELRKKRSKSKKCVRPCPSFVGYPDGDDAGDDSGEMKMELCLRSLSDRGLSRFFIHLSGPEAPCGSSS